MILTKEYINAICPEHGRASCDDSNLCNGFGGYSGLYDKDTGKPEVHYPRCNRCYLLNNVGEDISSIEFQVNVSVYLEFPNRLKCRSKIEK
jgi:hypothetical protein